MPISYALIARSTAVLAEFSTKEDNATEVARAVLQKLPFGEMRISYTVDGSQLHVLVVKPDERASGTLCVMCLAEEAFGRRLPFAFLEEILQRFISAYGKLAGLALTQAYNTEFSRVLFQQMQYFSANANLGLSVSTPHTAIKKGPIQKVEQVLGNDRSVHLLPDKTDPLQVESRRTRKEVKQLKESIWWRNCRYMGVIALATILLIYFFWALACGANLQC